MVWCGVCVCVCVCVLYKEQGSCLNLKRNLDLSGCVGLAAPKCVCISFFVWRMGLSGGSHGTDAGSSLGEAERTEDSVKSADCSLAGPRGERY